MPLLFDIECNGFKPSTIWMIGVIDLATDAFTAYVGDDVALGIARLAEADCLVGHYIKGFDIPVIERLTDGAVQFAQDRLIDTVELSRALFPSLENHKLKTWGEILGVPKMEFTDFDRFDPRMVDYCERDCRTNQALYEFLISQL